MSKHLVTLALSSISLMAILACGGGGGGNATPTPTPTPTPLATSIAYSNPTGVPATAFYLSRNASTSGSHLVLDLFGPTTAVTGSGLVLALNLDTTKATWSSVPAVNGSLFTTNVNGAPIFRSKITGNTLQVVATERGSVSAKSFSGPLLQIALDLKTDQTVGSTITLAPDLTKSQVLLSGTISALPDLKIGTLTAQ